MKYLTRFLFWTIGINVLIDKGRRGGSPRTYAFGEGTSFVEGGSPHLYRCGRRSPIDFEVKESKRLKRLQKELARKKKGSKNREKVLKKLQREYERLTNIRRDIHNKLLALLRHYGVVVYQDDDIKAWHEGWFGSQVQYAGIGMLKARLRNNLATIPVGRFEATTQECCVCGWKQKLPLSNRVYHCPVCGSVLDRDLNSAINILKKGLDLSQNQVVGMGRPELTPVERELVAKIPISRQLPSLKQEAPTSKSGGGGHFRKRYRSATSLCESAIAGLIIGIIKSLSNSGSTLNSILSCMEKGFISLCPCK